MPQIILQRYANREIRLGFQSIASTPKKKGDKAEDTRNERFAQKVLDLYVSSQNVIGGYELGLDRSGKAIALPYKNSQHLQLAKRLDIKNEFQDCSLKPKAKGGWGFSPRVTAFTKNARHRILEAGAIIDSFYGMNVAMLTCTIPGSTVDAFRVVSQYSGWIMNRMTQIVRDSKHNPGWFYVWELQKRGALHLHFAIGASKLADAVHLAQELEFKWFELLLELKEKCDVDCFRKNSQWTWRDHPKEWKSDCLPVRKSCAAYFSKYASKQSGFTKNGRRSFPPARWWGSSQSIKRGIEDARTKISVEVSLPNANEAITFLRNFICASSPLRQYKYDFDLGESKSGTNLGGGWREIYYFDDLEFNSISQYIDVLGEYLMQTWGVYADINNVCMQT